ACYRQVRQALIIEPHHEHLKGDDEHDIRNSVEKKRYTGNRGIGVAVWGQRGEKAQRGTHDHRDRKDPHPPVHPNREALLYEIDDLHLLVMVGQTKLPMQGVGDEIVILLPPGKIKPIFMFELHIDIWVSNTLYSHHNPNWITRGKIAENEGEESNAQQ